MKTIEQRIKYLEKVAKFFLESKKTDIGELALPNQQKYKKKLLKLLSSK